MRNTTLTLLFFWSAIFSGSTLLAQQQFNVTIELPSTIPLDDVEVYLEDLGKTKK